ncbi:hypothetical protein ASZ90_010851 [hydrocarbon metagenome]|uniref:Uncharacterized protein n=1 Tax=hydrocarbon metagenome TaxID=938273 RepID=A0A0W8FEV1_9ZZZZ
MAGESWPVSHQKRSDPAAAPIPPGRIEKTGNCRQDCSDGVIGSSSGVSLHAIFWMDVSTVWARIGHFEGRSPAGPGGRIRSSRLRLRCFLCSADCLSGCTFTDENRLRYYIKIIN